MTRINHNVKTDTVEVLPDDAMTPQPKLPPDTDAKTVELRGKQTEDKKDCERCGGTGHCLSEPNSLLGASTITCVACNGTGIEPTEEEKLRAALIKAIEIIEEISEYDGRGEIIGLKDLKKAAGLIVTAEVVSLGIHKGYYLFEERRADGVVKQFLCNPDDVDFYNLCLPKAVEMDKNPKIRAKRLQALAEFEAEKPPNVLKSVDEAVMPL